MTDRFKFRVWHKPSETYITNGNIDIANGVFATQNLLDADKFLIEQCTGLKDKNGKLIYEGDIITRNGMYRKVFWIDDEGGFGYEPSTLFEPLQTETCEVIGNIHENKDLLDE